MLQHPVWGSPYTSPERFAEFCGYMYRPTAYTQELEASGAHVQVDVGHQRHRTWSHFLHLSSFRAATRMFSSIAGIPEDKIDPRGPKERPW